MLFGLQVVPFQPILQVRCGPELQEVKHQLIEQLFVTNFLHSRTKLVTYRTGKVLQQQKRDSLRSQQSAHCLSLVIKGDGIHLPVYLS